MYRVQLLIQIRDWPKFGPNPCSLKPDLATVFVWQQHLQGTGTAACVFLGETQPRNLDEA